MATTPPPSISLGTGKGILTSDRINTPAILHTEAPEGMDKTPKLYNEDLSYNTAKENPIVYLGVEINMSYQKLHLSFL